jgi:uncharacterized membrane protein
MVRTPLLLAASFALLAAGLVAHTQPQKPPAKPTFARNAKPLLNKYCLSCHNKKDANGEVDVSVLKTEEDAKKNGRLMRKLGRSVKHKTMPPKGSLMPKDNERTQFVQYVESLK